MFCTEDSCIAGPLQYQNVRMTCLFYIPARQAILNFEFFCLSSHSLIYKKKTPAQQVGEGSSNKLMVGSLFIPNHFNTI